MNQEHLLTPYFLTNMLSSAIAPVTLISGISFLISIMASRYGRCIDRIRSLILELKVHETTQTERDHIKVQIKILYARIRTLRTTMACAALSIFGVVLTVMGSLSSLLFQVPNAGYIAAIFMVSLTLLVAALFGFVRDILISLRAVKIEIAKGFSY